LAIILLAFLGCMGLSVWGMMVSTPRPAPVPAPVTTEGIRDFPKAVQPFAMLARAQSLSVRDKFRGFTIKGIRADGTVDLTEENAFIRYSFQSASGRGPQPPREPGTLPNRRYCGVQHVLLDRQGIVAKGDNPHRACGSGLIEDLGEPRHCPITRLWKTAKKNGFDLNKPARLEYFEAEDGRAFRFTQKRKSIVVSARNCHSLFKGRASRGGPP
jgi:hypothetical protein